MEMYEKIRMLAERRGIPLTKVEQDLGFSPASLRKMQTSKPSADRVIALAKYFDVSTDFLYGTSEIEKPADRVLDHDLISLQRARQNMSGAEWDQAMKIFRAGFSFAFHDET